MTAGAKQKSILGGLWNKEHPSPLSQGFTSPLTPLSQEKAGLEMSRSPQWLKTSSLPPSSLNLASAISFPETSFHANPPLPLLIPGEFTSIRASAWRSQPLHMKAFHSSRQAEEMWSRVPLPHAALAAGSPLNHISTFRAQCPQPGFSHTPEAKGSRQALQWAGWEQQGELQGAIPRVANP